jgi:hypothetical protein
MARLAPKTCQIVPQIVIKMLEEIEPPRSRRDLCGRKGKEDQQHPYDRPPDIYAAMTAGMF